MSNKKKIHNLEQAQNTDMAEDNISVVSCWKLNNTRDCDEHLFGQVSTCTGRYQLTIFRSEVIFISGWFCREILSGFILSVLDLKVAHAQWREI